MALPLEGIKVIDLSRMAPGPFCTMVMADLGLDIRLGSGVAAAQDYYRANRAPLRAAA